MKMLEDRIRADGIVREGNVPFKYDKSYDFTIRSIYCGGYGGSDS